MLTTFSQSVLLPSYHMPGSIASTICDADEEYISQLINILETKTIRYIHYRITTLTTQGNCRASLCTPDDTSQPSFPGAVLGVGNSAYNDTNIDSAGWKRVQLVSDYAVSTGDHIFVKTSRVDAVSGNFRFGYNILLLNNDHMNYMASDIGSLTVLEVSRLAIALEADDGTFIKTTTSPFYSVLDTFNNTDTPDEIGNLISLPFAHRVVGIMACIDLDAACDLVMYGIGTSTISLVANRRSSLLRFQTYKYFATPITYAANEAYRVVYKPTSDQNVTVYESELPTGYETAVMANLFQGNSIQKTVRTDAGAWTETPTAFVNIQPIIDQIDFPPYISQMKQLGV